MSVGRRGTLKSWVRWRKGWPTLLVLLLLTSSASALGSGETIEDLDSRIHLLNGERQELFRRIAELDHELADLASRRERAAFAEGAKGGVFVQTATLAMMRSSPSTSAKVLREIPPSVKLRALDFVSLFWKIEYEGLLGYVSDVYIVRDQQAQAYFYGLRMQAGDANVTAPAPLIHPAHEEGASTLPGPRNPGEGAPDVSGRSSGASPESRGSVRCSAYTKKGARCQRMTTNASGRCWQHEK